MYNCTYYSLSCCFFQILVLLALHLFHSSVFWHSPGHEPVKQIPKKSTQYIKFCARMHRETDRHSQTGRQTQTQTDTDTYCTSANERFFLPSLMTPLTLFFNSANIFSASASSCKYTTP